ncbi:MAG: SPOR domain-containing protein [Vicinamibacteria bacterium]
MATTTDDGFHEIQLNGKQLVFLFMAVTVVSVVIFLCGVLVGRGVAAARGVAEPAPLEAPEMEVATDAPAAAPGPGGAPASANEELTYPDRLDEGAPVPEQLRDDVVPSGDAAEALPPDTTPAPTETPAAAAPAAAEAPPAASAANAEPPGDGFAIQVAALQNRQEADSVARRLGDRGYPAYVLAPAPGAPQVYRVRVGKYSDRREAEAVAGRLEKEEQFKPWITR